jgi:large subunit ribosomal protein L40e
MSDNVNTDPITQEPIQTSSDVPAVPAPVISHNPVFFIKLLSGKTINIDYDKDMSVLAVKQIIADKEQIPVDQQRLIYQGKQLEDVEKISAYGIEVDSTLHLILRLRGGQ